MGFPARTLNDLNLAAQQVNAYATGLICIRFTFSGTGVVTLGKLSGIKGRVVEALIIARDTASGATVQIKGGSAGTTVITDAMSKSDTAGVLTRAASIADVELASGDTLNAVASASVAAEVVLFIAPTQIPG